MISYWLVAYLAIAGPALVAAFLLTLATWEHRRFAVRRVQRPPDFQAWGRARVFAPCKGVDLGLGANLQPLFDQDYGDYEIVFIVESADDPACRTIEQLIAANPHVEAQLVVAGKATESGQKVHNLRVATAEIPINIEFLAFVDSDARPSPDWLRLLITRLDRSDTGATTGYRWFVPTRPTLANLMLYSINCSIAGLLGPGGFNLVWGGSWVVRSEVFESTKLHEAWYGTLSDDLVASRVLNRARLRVEYEPLCIVASPLDMRMGEAMSFLRRQFVIGRYYSSLYWAGTLMVTSIINVALFGGIVASALWAGRGSAAAIVPAAVAGTLVAMNVLRSWLRQDIGRKRFPHLRKELTVARRMDIIAGPLVGLATWLAMVAAACGTRVTWRGLRYRIFPGGQIQLLNRESEPPADQEPADLQSMPFDHLRRHASRRRRLAAAERPLD
jgi:hypothetical protein